MDNNLKNYIEIFIKNIHITEGYLLQAQKQLNYQLQNCYGEIQNLHESSSASGGKVLIIQQKMQRIPKIQQKIDIIAKKLLEAHKRIAIIQNHMSKID